MFALVPKMAAQPERQGCDLTKVIVNDDLDTACKKAEEIVREFLKYEV